jgi:hypothetical protein
MVVREDIGCFANTSCCIYVQHKVEYTVESIYKSFFSSSARFPVHMDALSACNITNRDYLLFIDVRYVLRYCTWGRAHLWTLFAHVTSKWQNCPLVYKKIVSWDLILCFIYNQMTPPVMTQDPSPQVFRQIPILLVLGFHTVSYFVKYPSSL